MDSLSCAKSHNLLIFLFFCCTILSGMKTFWLLFFIVVFGAFLRFYHLSSNPPGLNQDETAIGYNAYSILTTGRDEHGAFMPLYFKSFNDYKLPGYIYLTAASEKIFGVTPFAVRFPSALFGSLTLVGLFFLVKRLTNSTALSLISALFLAINPWSIFFSRVAFEVNVATSLLVFGSLFFILAIQKKHALFLYILPLFCFGLSLYTYNVTRIFAPVLLLILIFLYRKEFVTMRKMKLLFLCVCFLITLIPFVLTLRSHSGLSYQTNVLIFGGESKASLIEFRSYMTGLPKIISSLFFNTFFLTLWLYGRNIIASLSTTFFFTSAGAAGGDIGIGTSGAFYLIEFFTILAGIYGGLKSKTKGILFFLLWAAGLFLLGSLSGVVPAGTRDFPVSIALIVLSAYGTLTIFSYIRKQHQRAYKISLIGFSIIFLYGFLSFVASYFLRFPIMYAQQWRPEDRALSLDLQQLSKKYNHIVIDTNVPFIYTSLAFYQQYPAHSFQKDVVYQPDQLFTNVTKIGKYEFRKIDWSHDARDSKTLFVTEPTNLPSHGIVLKTYYYPTRPVVISVQNTIAQYPYTEPIFSIVSVSN